MKRLATFAACGMLALSITLFGCSTGNTNSKAAETTEEQTSEESSAPKSDVVGGWVLNDEAKSLLTDEQSKIFSEAISQMPGFDYEPTALIATQKANGESYAFLCRGRASADAVTKWYIAVANKGSDGVIALSFVIDLDIPNVRAITDAPYGSSLGSWEVVEATDVELLPSEAATAFDKATKDLKDVSLKPYAVLGSQLVSGNNYLVLCSGIAEGETVPTIYVVQIYADLQGGAEVTNLAQLDLMSYVRPSA